MSGRYVVLDCDCVMLIVSTCRYPSSSLKKHDWSQVERDIQSELQNDKPEGDAALDALFKDIYAKVCRSYQIGRMVSHVLNGFDVMTWNRRIQTLVEQ